MSFRRILSPRTLSPRTLSPRTLGPRSAALPNGGRGAQGVIWLLLSASACFSAPAAARGTLHVVATLPTYGAIAKVLLGNRGEVASLARGYEDPHFVRPKPSHAMLLREADLLVSTGLDLELWLPALLDKANNPRLRSGQPGFVSAAAGVHLLNKPRILTRNEGDVHIYGNPHIYTSPLNGKVIARNIMLGLCRVDPAGAALYRANYARFVAELDKRLYGPALVKILGATVLDKLALLGKLVPFLQGRSFRGKKLVDYLGGWLGRGLPLRGRKLVTYHQNWVYFSRLFGLEVVDRVEPKPGIPPSPGHVGQLIEKMRKEQITVLLAANYFDRAKVESIARRVGARSVIVPLSVDGEPAARDFFALFDGIIERLVAAFGEKARR